MPRKAAASADGTTDAAEPRRSSRIKDMPKPEPVVKKPAKPRTKKADKEAKEGDEEKPKSAKGKKRKADEGPAGEAAAEDDGEKAPPSKKVRHHCQTPGFSGFVRLGTVYLALSSLSFLGQTCLQGETRLEGLCKTGL